MQYRLGALSLLSLFVGCSAYSEATLPEISMCSMTSTSPQRSEISQGIQGTVTQLSGDQMPSDRPNQTAAETPITTTVWIFRDRIPGEGSPQWSVADAQQHPALICKVESNQTGQYKAQLPLGEYTVFAQYDEALYLNSFQGDGSFESVAVHADEIVELNLIHTEQAFF